MDGRLLIVGGGLDGEAGVQSAADDMVSLSKTASPISATLPPMQ